MLSKKKSKNSSNQNPQESPREGEQLRKVRAATPTETGHTSHMKWISYSYYLIVGMAICLGLYLRLQIYLYHGVNGDEIWRMMRILSGPHEWLEPFLQAPGGVGYMFVNWILTGFYNTEYVFRLTSLIPSGISLILVFLISTMVFHSRIIVLSSVFLTSFNPFTD